MGVRTWASMSGLGFVARLLNRCLTMLSMVDFVVQLGTVGLSWLLRS